MKDQMKELQSENEMLKDKMRAMMLKFDDLKANSDKYQMVVELIESQKRQSNADVSVLIDSTLPVCLDVSHPDITINTAQRNVLKGISNAGAATRALMDMLFMEEQFRGKNCSTLEKEFPDRMKAIKTYVNETYNVEAAKITKFFPYKSVL